MAILVPPIAQSPRHLFGQATQFTGPLAVAAAVLAESRPGVQVVFLMRSTAGSGLVQHPSLKTLYGIGGWVLITIAIYVFNGVTDLEADRTNSSKRPLATGHLSTVTALRACLALAAVGIGLCWLVGPFEVGLAVGFLALGWAYSAGPALKNSATGFAVVIGLGAALTYSAGWVAGGRITTHGLVLALSVSLWVGVCCASKDFSDIDGDRVAGRHTWPVVLGTRRAARVLSALAVATAVGTVVIAARFGANVAPAVTLTIGSLALAAVAVRSASAPARATRRRPYRAFISTQYATNASMLIFGAL
jgi:4-hydroxybenzoate polyprenyltransferase